MSVPETVRRLVERFEEHRQSYLSGKYNEAQLRREFLDPFFKALGWDLDNDKNYNEKYKEVVVEDSLDVEGTAKAPDYAFRIGGMRKFFVEAKKPSINIQYDIQPAFQLRRYAWSAKLPLGILTDFEEFAVYESRSKPDKGDHAATGRVMLLKYQDYLTHWDELVDIFSPQAIMQGSFDKYAEGVKGKKGTLEVDDAFLQEIERWRELLARNLALRNPDLQNVRELNYAVQMTIDRIVFLRICEDRGIERDEQLKELLEGEQIYERMCSLFKQADDRYNSGLFHFAKEKDQSSLPDDLTLRLAIDDKVLKEILRGLYYPSPYVFSEIPADILGQVYERFLGKVIRLTPGHQAKVEEKPEVRKAGGVYYTPTYIVEYIVKNTVGKLLEGKTAREVSALKVLDPACGSGSFLLGAFQYLLDWHLRWYTEHEPAKFAQGKSPALYQGQVGDWRLTTAEKKRILLNNLYGVDIDPQAVEVTKLSLSLKVLEGESEQSMGKQLGLFKERALPDLGCNIQCGNSLIGSDYYERKQLTMTFADEEERYRVNAFNWKAAFPRVFMAGGFDGVIGNPPYIRIQALQEWAPTEVEFYKKKYKAASKGNYDIYVVFVEKGLSLLNEKGRLGFILPHKFFNTQYGEPFRELISEGKHLAKVVHFGDQQVFENATTYTCLMFLDKSTRDQFEFERVNDLKKWRIDPYADCACASIQNISSSEWNFSTGDKSKLLNRLSQFPTKLGDISEKIFQGLVSSSDAVYFLEPRAKEKDGYIQVFSTATGKIYDLETAVVRPLLKGSRDISRYSVESSKRVIFPYDPVQSAKTGKTILIPAEEFESKYPRTWNYLKENYDILRNREKGKMRHSKWYGYVYPKSVSLFGNPKILTPSIAAQASFVFDEKGEYYFVGSGGGGGGGYGISLKNNIQIEYKYLLGLLNSKLLDFFLKSVSSTFRGGYFAFNKQYIELIPIQSIDFKNSFEKRKHDKIVSLVECMLELHKRSARTPQEQERLRREIEATDAQIDRLVYELYGLTEEEVKIVEGTE